jgi:hypothetical protein
MNILYREYSMKMRSMLVVVPTSALTLTGALAHVRMPHATSLHMAPLPRRARVALVADADNDKVPLLPGNETRRRLPSDSPLISVPIDMAVDTVGDGKLDSLTVDTLGDSVTDTIVPLDVPDQRPERAVPPRVQRAAQRVLALPALEVLSLVLTTTLIVTYAVEGDGSMISDDAMNAFEKSSTCYFAFEFVLRWVAAGLEPRYLLTPLMVVDFLNLLPLLVGLTPLAALRLLRVLRVLRLRRLLGRGEIDRLASALTGDANMRVSEVQRVALNLALSVVSILLVSAGAAWECERAVNPAFASYADALYFSITTLTTVGCAHLFHTHATVTRVLTVVAALIFPTITQ